MRRALLTAAAVISLAIPLSAAAPPVLAQAGTFAYTECPVEMPPGEVEGETVDCGYLTVPADHADPRGPTIDLAVAILYAETDEPQPDPVVYLEGGPGGETITDFDSWRGYPLLDDRDLVLFDQRGTGWSIPLLDCPAEIDELDGAEYAAALAACRDELLAEGIDLALFDSRQSAADVEALRQALGYEQWNLYGISYGTRLALTVMRDYPEGVRSAVLDSVYPPQVYTLEELASDELAGLESMFDGCAADRACQAAYPYLEWDFYDVIDALDAEPMVVDYTDDDGEPYSEELTAPDFFATVVGCPEQPRPAALAARGHRRPGRWRRAAVCRPGHRLPALHGRLHPPGAALRARWRRDGHVSLGRVLRGGRLHRPRAGAGGYREPARVAPVDRVCRRGEPPGRLRGVGLCPPPRTSRRRPWRATSPPS